MATPRMFYFGPWDQPGHFLFNEHGYHAGQEEHLLPWKWAIDGVLQPGCYRDGDRWEHKGPQTEGEALVHHKDGWTALSFWDRSVDTRYGCNSTYFAEGIWTFDQMVALARARFSKRWDKMSFQVRPYTEAP